MFSPATYEDRSARIQTILEAEGLDYLIVGPGANLLYFAGIDAHISSRLIALVIPKSGRPRMIVPALEKPAVEAKATFFDLLPWSDSDTSAPALRTAFPDSENELWCAVDNQLWSGHLLDLQKTLPYSRWTKGSDVIRKVRARKSSEEIALMKHAASIADRTLAKLTKQQFSGRTEKEIMAEITRLLVEFGDDAMSFCIVGAGENSAIPHHNCTDRVIKPGEPVLLDFGGSYRGYQSDMTRMVWVKGGNPSEEFLRVYETVNAARQAGHDAARAGVSGEAVDAATRSVIEKAGYGEFFIHRTGHGLGIDLHEDPYIIPGNTEPLETGNAFSIEPGIYLQGKFGVRIEDIAVITDPGEENINLSSHELLYVD
jgi:Xaa-Pro aminopeptidase